MRRKSSVSRAKILMIIWLLTAAAALIVTVVYFGELQELYSTVKTIEDSKNSPQGQAGPGKNTDPSGGGAVTAAADKTTPSAEPEPTADAASTADPAAETSPTLVAAVTPETKPTQETTPTPDAEPTPEPTPTPEVDLSEHAYYYDPNLDPSKPIIALSFDDGPSQYTQRIIDAIQKNGVKATFFMVGYQIDAYKDEVRAVYEAGCQVANHTLDHADLKKLSKEDIKKQVYDNEKKINNIVPVGEIIVRPPYGNVNDTVKSVIERPMFNWSVDSLDWKTRNADSIVAQIKADAKDGYIILMHDLYETTAEAAERIIPWLIEQGYQVTCISNMFEARGDEVLPGHLYRYASPAKTE